MSVEHRGQPQTSRGGGGLDQLIHGDFLKIVGGLHAELGHQGLSGFGGVSLRDAFQIRPALDDGAVEQALGSGHRQQRADFPGAAGLPVDGDIVRVAAEIRDVVVDPLQAAITSSIPTFEA